MDELLVSGFVAIGGLLFGIALFRARVLARWASALFAYGTVSVLALGALPESFNRPFAIPTGVALIGLGVGLWRDQHAVIDVTDAPIALPVPANATSESHELGCHRGTPRPLKRVRQRTYIGEHLWANRSGPPK